MLAAFLSATTGFGSTPTMGECQADMSPPLAGVMQSQEKVRCAG